MMPEINPAFLKNGLRTKTFGKKIIFLDRVDSTNRYAWKLAELGEDEGTIVLAKVQEEGKARMDRKWFSPEGGLWFSVILRPSLKAYVAERVMLMAGVSIVESIRELYDLDARLKWVNDVLINSKKVSGVLAETSITGKKLDFVILGIGVNVNIDSFPEDLEEKATSIKLELGRDVSINELAIDLIMKLENNYRLIWKKASEIAGKWRRYSDTIGRFVEIVHNEERLRGKAVDIDENGFLVLRLESGELVKVTIGTCYYLESL